MGEVSNGWSPDWERQDPSIVGWIPVACTKDEKTGIVSQWEVMGPMVTRAESITPEPSADVVEKIEGAIVLGLSDTTDSYLWRTGYETEAEIEERDLGPPDMWDWHDISVALAKRVAPIIETEVQRRMAQPAAKPQQHDPDDWPEAGMEKGS